MIQFDRFCLHNGLRVLVHEDRSSPLVALNILYDVGSRDEKPDMTGLAHLFEHLMFSGTPRVPEFDRHLQLAGGENNAFTTSDITCYYITLPAPNIETALWLESDRMSGLDFSPRNLDIQKNVVVEEFNQRYLNQPYGDAMLMLRPLAYKVHPYRWPTIGVDPSHIMKAGLEEIKEFFYSHYAPNNANLTMAGSISTSQARRLCEKWFGPVEKRKVRTRRLPSEPVQVRARLKTVTREVPATAIYRAWHCCRRSDPDFYALDMVTDILSGGESGRLHTALVRGKRLFSELNAFLSSDIEPGLILLQGKLMKDVDADLAEEAIDVVIGKMMNRKPPASEIEKVRNKYESASIYGNTNILNKAHNLAFYELIGNPDLINSEVELYKKTDGATVVETVRKYLGPENCSTLRYLSSSKGKR